MHFTARAGIVTRTIMILWLKNSQIKLITRTSLLGNILFCENHIFLRKNSSEYKFRFLVKYVCQHKPGGGGRVRQMSTPVNKGEGGVKNTKNSVNVVYERPLVFNRMLFLSFYY